MRGNSISNILTVICKLNSKSLSSFQITAFLGDLPRITNLFYLFIYLEASIQVTTRKNKNNKKTSKSFKSSVKLDEGLANGLVIPARSAVNEC